MPYDNVGIYYSHIFDIQKDIVITIDYVAHRATVGAVQGGILIGFLPYYHISPDGVGPVVGLGYSNDINSSPTGIDDAMWGVGFDFNGLFSSLSTGSGGLSSFDINSIALRGPASMQYPLLASTSNLTASEEPFKLYGDVNNVTPDPIAPRTIRVRLTDFGTHIIADTKKSKEESFVKRLDYYTQNISVPKYMRIYCAFVAEQQTSLSVQNINLNGYNVTLSYVYSGADYLGLTPNPATLTETQLLSVVNVYPNSLAPILSSLGPLILIKNDASGAPYVADHTSLSQRYSMYYTPSAGDSFIFVDYQ
jgi:hypothetical protein